jgi:hypothetical protein
LDKSRFKTYRPIRFDFSVCITNFSEDLELTIKDIYWRLLIFKYSSDSLASVSEKDIGAVEAGSRADVRLDAFPDHVFSAKVQRIARIAKQNLREEARKFFECELLLEVPVDLMESLKPGMRFDSEILGGSWQNAFVLPKGAVLKQEKGWIVYLSKEGSYHEQKVDIISSDHGFYLLSGLQEGDVVCLQHPFEKQKLVLPDFSAPATASQTTRFVIFN